MRRTFGLMSAAPTLASGCFQGHSCSVCLSLIIKSFHSHFPTFYADHTHCHTHTNTRSGTHTTPLERHKVKLKINQKQNGGHATQIDVDIQNDGTLLRLLGQLYFCVFHSEPRSRMQFIKFYTTYPACRATPPTHNRANEFCHCICIFATDFVATRSVAVAVAVAVAGAHDVCAISFMVRLLELRVASCCLS